MLKTLLLLPVVGAFLIALVPARYGGLIRRVAITLSGLTLGWSLWLATAFDPGDEAVQLLETDVWNPRLGSAFTLGVDGISLPLVWLACLLAFIATLASGAVRERVRVITSCSCCWRRPCSASSPPGTGRSSTSSGS